MAMKHNIVVDQGSAFDLTFNLLDENDDPINTEGYVIRSQIRKFYTSSSYINFNVEIFDQSTGIINISLSANTTSQIVAGRYVYDVELVINNIPKRILEGIVTVTPEVTK